ncbi:MAG: YceI family protein [Pyrinomonadaceae bacterium]
MKRILIGILSAAVFAVACADPAANKPKAQTSAPTANDVVQTEAKKADVLSDFKANGTALEINADNSKVEFTGSKVTGKHDGGFKLFKGVIDLVGEKAESSRVLFEIEMSSVFTDTDGLTKHLRTGDFFEAEKYPKSTFESTKIESDMSKTSGNFTVTGKLEMRGVKKSVTFPATIAITPENVLVAAEFSINRKDFGIVYAGKADDLIRDDVVIRLELEAPRKK